MGKSKLKKFAQINTFSNVIQPEDKYPVVDSHLRGRWNQGFFMNTHPIVLEIGCGKGEYSFGLAKTHPMKNFIGIDIKGDRIYQGARQAIEEGLHNLAFLRIQAERIAYFFGKDEVSGIWLTFPDPHLRGSRRKKRLTSPQFLERYRGILRPGSQIHLKTDNTTLFNYTLETIREEGHTLLFATDDLYAGKDVQGSVPAGIQTYYEEKFLSVGMPICYLRFHLA